jgi:anaerobic ribonucleoside-triphosphate reductase activating protein
MNIAEIITCDSANGPGMRTSVFVSGCERHCEGCFNKVAWDPKYGEAFNELHLEFILKEMEKPYCAGLSVLGGEPLEEYNMFDVADLVKTIRMEFPEKTIWLYTGKLFEDLIHDGYKTINQILHSIDVLVDGPFEEELKDPSLPYRGSSNQRIIDMQKTLAKGCIVLHDKMKKEAY